MSQKNGNMASSITNAIIGIMTNIRINCYVEENLLLKKISYNEEIPILQYLNELNILQTNYSVNINDFDGFMIYNGRIRNINFEELCFDFYKSKIELIFRNAPKYQDNENDICHYKNGLYEYLKTIYKTFKEIIQINLPVEIPISDFTPNHITSYENDLNCASFIATILIKKLKLGKCVDKYLKNMDYIPDYLLRLVHKENNHYILINNNPNSKDYILALFSCFTFSTQQNKLIYHTKLSIWENQIK